MLILMRIRVTLMHIRVMVMHLQTQDIMDNRIHHMGLEEDSDAAVVEVVGFVVGDGDNK